MHGLAERRPYLTAGIQALRPRLDALVLRLQQPVVLVRLCGSRRQLLMLRAPDRDGLDSLPIDDQDIYGTASGRLLLAHLSRHRRQRLIDELGLPAAGVWPGVVDRQELLAECRQLRRAAWAGQQTADWHTRVVWVAGDVDGLCIGTFARPGRLRSDSLVVLQTVQTELTT